MMYRLSLIIPVFMRSKYTLEDGTRQKCTWIQWRDRVFWVRRTDA